MKKILVIIAISISLSCNLAINEATDLRYELEICDRELYEVPNVNQNTIRGIGRWFSDNIKYKFSFEVQEPKQTYKRRFGECLDQCILFMNIAYYELGIKMDLICVNKVRHVGSGGISNHVYVRHNNKIYTYKGVEVKDIDIKYYYHFDEVFK